MTVNDERTRRPETDLSAPDELHTEADDETPLSHQEAEVAGIVPGMVVYGDSSIEPNADDHRDNEHADRDDHM